MTTQDIFNAVIAFDEATVVAKTAGEAGRHIRERGFDKQYY